MAEDAMTSPQDKTPAPSPKPPADPASPPPRRKLVRFDFPPGASLDEIVRGVREMTQRHGTPKP
jgi:hypothetical protein